MEQHPVCSSISKRNDVGDREKSPSSSIMFTISKICNGVTQNTIMQNLSRNSTCYGIYETVNKSLCTNELWNICQVYNSPADGHCLLHSVVSSLKHQLVPNVDIDTNYLLNVISYEISQHPEGYLGFIKNNDRSVLFDGFRLYAKHKQYDTVFGDHIPLILANVLNISLIIINESSDGLFKVETVQTNNECIRLFLHKRADHYNAIIPTSLEPLWQPGLAHIDDVLIADYDKDNDNVLVSNVSQLNYVHVHDVNNTDYENGNVVVTNVSPSDHVYVDDVFDTKHDNDNSNALVSTVSPTGFGQGDNIFNTDYDGNDNTVVPNVCQQDDRSTLDGEKLSDIPNFLYQLKMHRKAHPTNLLSGSLNINSIRHKFPTVDYILQNRLIDIFGICETKLDNSFSEAQFHVENFIYYRKDRFASGGGVMLYVRSDIPQRRRHDLEKLVDCSESGLEIIIIEIITDSKERWMYVMGYKPPDIKTSLFVNTFSLMCDLILKESNNVIVLGDYNCNFMSDNELKDLCISFDIHNLVNTPTCYKIHSGTLVDVCLVSKPFRFKTTLNLDCWLSDFHNFICVTTKLSLPKRQPRIIQYRSYKNFVEELFVTDLCILSQIMMHYNHNVDVCVETFITYLCGIIDKHAPMKTKKVYQNNVPYMNSELRKLNYKRNMMRNIKNKHPCPENFERYRVLRNKCVKAKVKSQRKYFAERCDGGPKNQHFWPTIKPFINSRYNVKENIILREGDDIINNTESVVKIFNEYFNQIASDIGFNDPIPDSYADDDVLLSFIAKYNSHPSIIAIKSAVHEYGYIWI